MLESKKIFLTVDDSIKFQFVNNSNAEKANEK